MTDGRAALLVVAVPAIACLVVAASLVSLRLAQDRREQRRARLRGAAWRHVLALTTGEDDEVIQAREALAGLPRRATLAIAEDAFALVPKVRGAGRDRLRGVLRGWGLEAESRHLARSRSVVARCRGIHRLAVLADPDAAELVSAALTDRAFAVRRTAMLAAGSFPEPGLLSRALDRVVAEPALRRDFLAAVVRMGGDVVPVLRLELGRGLRQGEDGERRARLAAEAIGLVGGIGARSTLESALVQGGPELRMACIEALGELGSAASVPVLVGALADPDPEVRRATARALGRIGGEQVLFELALALDDPAVEVARTAAQSLQRSGPAGMMVLRSRSAAVARETVALAELARA